MSQAETEPVVWLYMYACLAIHADETGLTAFEIERRKACIYARYVESIEKAPFDSPSMKRVGEVLAILSGVGMENKLDRDALTLPYLEQAKLKNPSTGSQLGRIGKSSFEYAEKLQERGKGIPLSPALVQMGEDILLKKRLSEEGVVFVHCVGAGQGDEREGPDDGTLTFAM